MRSSLLVNCRYKVNAFGYSQLEGGCRDSMQLSLTNYLDEQLRTAIGNPLRAALYVQFDSGLERRAAIDSSANQCTLELDDNWRHMHEIIRDHIHPTWSDAVGALDSVIETRLRETLVDTLVSQLFDEMEGQIDYRIATDSGCFGQLSTGESWK